jgi:hypothetical protein
VSAAARSRVDSCGRRLSTSIGQASGARPDGLGPPQIASGGETGTQR